MTFSASTTMTWSRSRTTQHNTCHIPPTGATPHPPPKGMRVFEGTNSVGAMACRPLSPPLTDITASDVKFDDTICKLPGVTNVQEAIDALCGRDGGICT